MTNDAKEGGPVQKPLDRSDERVRHATSVGGAITAFLDRVRSGDLGSLPVVVGLVADTKLRRISQRTLSARSPMCV